MLGKCLDAHTDTDGTVLRSMTATKPILSETPSGSGAGQLELRGKCITVANDTAANGTPVVLEPCRVENSGTDIWQIR